LRARTAWSMLATSNFNSGINPLTNESGLGGSPSPPSNLRAVFLSYASEDADAAHRICAALRSAGIEVWFDQSELRGGDLWDAAIRKQIRSCAIFIPIISSNTHARIEGYFRLEWKLAIDRSHLLAPDQPFLLPVAIDQTPQTDDRLPDRFRELQWIRLPDGNTPSAFAERVAHLLSANAASAPAPRRSIDSPSERGARINALAPGASDGRDAAALPRSSKTAWSIALVVVVVGLGIAALYFFVSHRRGIEKAPPATTEITGTPAMQSPIPERSIAVLPFLDMSEKKDQEYFSDGLAEELLDLLSQVPDLRVPARTSSFYFKGRDDDVMTIARKLRVAHLLEGSVRRSGDKIRVTAQLIRADTGYHLWSKTYDRDAQDIFQVQDEIANAVVNALKLQLLPAQPLANHHRTASSDAFAAYLMGNNLRELDTEESNPKALESYQRAIALDPNYAAAYSGLADAEWRVADMLTSEPAGYQRAFADAARAITLAPDSADGYWARGNLRWIYSYDAVAAELDLKKALELDPNDVRVLRGYAELLAGTGRMTQALEMLLKATGLDPLSEHVWRDLTILHIDLGQLDQAKRDVQHLMAIQPDSYFTHSAIGEIALIEKRYSDALTEFRYDSDWKLIGGAMAEHSLGHESASQAALNELTQKRSAALAYQIAQAYAWCDQPDQAFLWLGRAYRQHDGGLTYLKHDHFFARLRKDPRYSMILKKMNLPP
jgi:TolB-like protein